MQTEKWHQTYGIALVLCSFTAFMLCTASAHAQDCTNPNGIKGDVIFNSTYDVMQGCTARGWMAFHQPASDPCP